MADMTGHPNGPRRHRRRLDQRGAALVEAAIVMPLLLMLIFGMIEFGFLFKDSLTVANAARAGARVGSSAGNDPLADYNILKSVQGASGLTNVKKIVVFKASGPTGTIPAQCMTGPVAGVCNYYVGADLSIDQVTFLSAGYTKDDSWPAASRVTSLAAPGGPDYIGVWLEVHHTSMTKLWGDKDIHDTAVMRLEPSR